MRVLYLYKYGVLGGVSTQLVNRMKYLKNYCEPHFGFFADYGIAQAFEGYQYVPILGNINMAADYIKNIGFDAITVIDTNEAYEAIKGSGFKGVIIHETHTTYTHNLIKLHELQLNTPVDAIITPSKYLRERIINEFRLSGTKPVYTIENCLDTYLFKYRDIDIQSDKRIILWIGKLDAHKNWPMFISIANSIKQKALDCEFWLVGGYTAPEKAVKDLNEMVESLELADSFKWFPRIEYYNMPDIYSMAAKSGGLYISTSQNESFGMTVLEALACRCPVVAPRVGAIPEILDDDLSSYLYELNNVEEAVSKILLLTQNSDSFRGLLDAGEKKVREQYDIKITGEKYLKILTDEISKKQKLNS